MKPSFTQIEKEGSQVIKAAQHQNLQEPAQPPLIHFGTEEFLGVPEMDGLTTKSDRQVMNEEDNDSEDEGIEDYKIGGYHPVHIGEVVIKRYVVLQKLGWGHFSTVWLAKDFKFDTYVALKIQKSAPHYLEAAYDEVEILQKVAKQAQNPLWIKELKEYYKNDHSKKAFTRDDCQVVQLLNSFVYRGPYGNHFCMVFEILGVNLLEIIKRYNYKGIPMHLARIISKQILIGLDFLHRFCGVIHTDLKPENVLLCLTQEEIKQIVEKGQLENNRKFLERIRHYQQAHGIDLSEPVIASNPKVDLTGQDSIKGDIMTSDNNKNVQDGNSMNNISTATTAATLNTSAAAGVGLPNGTTNHNDTNRLVSQSVVVPETSKENGKQSQQLQQNGDQNDLSDSGSDADGEADAKNKANLTKKQKKNLKRKQSHKRKKQREKQAEEGEKEKKGVAFLEDELAKKQQQGQEQPQQKPEVRDEDIPDDVRYRFDNWNGRGERMLTNVRVKIADLGNACWTHHHFATEIQTRQYRSPETIIGVHYNPTADVWSFACMIFEMLTGDFLFEPRKGPTFSKNDDHIAQIQELCRRFSNNFSLAGYHAKKYFDRKGNLRRIPNLHFWPLLNVLIEKYHFKEEEAKLFDDFMQPMLRTDPLKRSTAQEALHKDWINGKTNYLFKYSDQEFQRYQDKKKLLSSMNNTSEADDKSGNNDNMNDNLDDSEINDADGSGNDEDDWKTDEEDDEKFYGQREFDLKLVDRSFTNLGYIGFGEGIKLDDLDQDANWQFMNYKNE